MRRLPYCLITRPVLSLDVAQLCGCIRPVAVPGINGHDELKPVAESVKELKDPSFAPTSPGVKPQVMAKGKKAERQIYNTAR